MMGSAPCSREVDFYDGFCSMFERSRKKQCQYHEILDFRHGDYEDYAVWDMTPCSVIFTNVWEENAVSIFRVYELLFRLEDNV
jgi:hypothetical protein